MPNPSNLQRESDVPTLRKTVKEGRYSPSGDGITLKEDPNGNIVLWTQIEWECSIHGNVKDQVFQLGSHYGVPVIAFCLACVQERLIAAGVAHHVSEPDKCK